MASLINFTRVILQSLYQASFNILNDNSLGGGVEGIWKMMGSYFLIFRVAQNLVLMTFWDTSTLKVLRKIHAPDDITRVKI